MTFHSPEHFAMMRQRKKQLQGEQTPHQRAREKIGKVCALALRWGFVTPRMTQQVLGIAVRGTCSKLQKAGYLRKYVVGQIGLRHMPNTIYTLTENGLHEAERYSDIEQVVKHNTRSSLSNISKYNTEHDYLVALMILDLMATGKYSRYMSSKELNALSERDHKQFDAVIFEKCEPGEFSSATEFPVGIEVELTRKSSARTYDFILKLYLAVQSNTVERVRIFTDLPSIQQHIESYIEKCEAQKKIPRYGQLKIGNKLDLLGFEPMTFSLRRYLTVELIR